MDSGARHGRNEAAGSPGTLANIGILSALSPRELTLLAVECDWRDIPRHEIILDLAQGGTLPGVAFVVKGAVRLSRGTGVAGRITYSDIGAGQQFGEMSIFGVMETDLTAVAREDSTIATMPERRFIELLSREESVSRALLCQYARALRMQAPSGPAPQVAARRSEGTGAQRVYGELLALAEPGSRADGGDCLLIARLPRHRELAARLDTTEETVARAIAELVRAGVAMRDYPGLVIADEAALKALCDLS